MKFSILRLFAVAAAAALTTSLRAADNPATGLQSLNGNDTKFAIAATQDGETEVQLGKIAEERGSSPAVKDFAKQMASDHAKANAELKALCSKRGVVLPTSLDSDHQSMLDNVTKKDSKSFDKAYADEMVSAHKKAVSAFEAADKDTTDAGLRTFIEGTLPTLKHHLAMAESMQKSVK
jgi:putative membrane protein